VTFETTVQGCGNAFGSSRVLDEKRLPIEEKVFMGMLSCYKVRSQADRPSRATTDTNAAQLAGAAHRRNS
jgi:hypothetical protein